MPSGRAFCSAVSLEHAEPLAATASRVDHWLLVEYRGPWSRDALAGSGLPDEVKAHLRRQAAARPRTKLLLVRRNERRREPGLAVLWGSSRERGATLYHAELESYGDLLALDLTADGHQRRDSQAEAPDDPRGRQRDEGQGEWRADRRGESLADGRGRSPDNRRGESEDGLQGGESEDGLQGAARDERRGESRRDRRSEPEDDRQGESCHDRRGDPPDDRQGESREERTSRGAGAASIGQPVAHPVLLVCTHGKHDRCCARYGRPLSRALEEHVEEEWVWQSSHLGGDRFAGNVVVLPEGLYYGRVAAAHARTLLEAHLAGRIDLPHYRGRSCYSFAVQAAERAVREETGLVGIDDLELAGVTDDTVRFRAAGRVYELEVREAAGPLAYLTCSAETLRRPRRYAARILRESAA